MSYIFEDARIDRSQQSGQNQRGGTMRPDERKDDDDEKNEGSAG